MKHIKTYNLFESGDDIIGIVSDVMNEFSDEYKYIVSNIKGHEYEKYYRDNLHGRNVDMIIEIGSTNEKLDTGNFTKSWEGMLMMLYNHLNEYGYNCEVVTHISNGMFQYNSIPNYIKRVKREAGRVGDLLSGMKFMYPFTIYLKKNNIFEGTEYHEDDLNVNITSTVSDIFEDLTDDSDFDISCFTVGYSTLKDAGATHTDNDIHFSITREYYEHENETINKTFSLNQIMPYLKRTIEFIESEGRVADKIYYQFRFGGRLKQTDVDKDALLKGGEFQIESLSMYFKLNDKSLNENANQSLIDELMDLSLDLTDDGEYLFGVDPDSTNSKYMKAYLYKLNTNRSDTDRSRFSNFTMTKEVSDFLIRLKTYLNENYPQIEITASSNRGYLYIYPDDRGIRSSGYKLRPEWPTLTAIKIDLVWW